ncbi:uncharacterized protein TrAFT101_011495 [Trichoderma asperellum]|uniref:uncharacterized protein n=1 Tax=Trichoderma asperellum TaxID=101201 RepID=UPI00331A5C39|nr:hypothetical protein TrAFT101_011495 [Trichoderma asperellum]
MQVWRRSTQRSADAAAPVSSAASHCSTVGFSGRRANPSQPQRPLAACTCSDGTCTAQYGAPVRRRRTADGLSLPARSISSLSSLFLVLRAILVDVAPARQTFANTLRTGERLRGESDGLDWQTPGQLARTLPPTLRPRGPVLSLQRRPPPSPPRRACSARPSAGLTHQTPQRSGQAL